MSGIRCLGYSGRSADESVSHNTDPPPRGDLRVRLVDTSVAGFNHSAQKNFSCDRHKIWEFATTAAKVGKIGLETHIPLNAAEARALMAHGGGETSRAVPEESPVSISVRPHMPHSVEPSVRERSA